MHGGLIKQPAYGNATAHMPTVPFFYKMLLKFQVAFNWMERKRIEQLARCLLA